MATQIVLPMLGQTMEEGTIIQWFKQEGERIEKGEPLLEVMTDKVNMEVESPESGTIRKILAQPDDTVPIMAPIAIIGTPDELIDDLLTDDNAVPTSTVQVTEVDKTISAIEPVPTTSLELSSSPPSRVFVSPRARRIAQDNNIPIDSLAGRGTGPQGRIVEKDVQAYVAEMGSGVVKASPLAAKVADDKGIDLREIIGTGRHGKIMRDDVLHAVAPSPDTPTMHARSIPFAGMRKMVADAVAKSAQTAPHVTLTAEVDMTETVKVRNHILSEFERKYGARISYTDFIVKASARAILDHPILNASLQGDEIRIPGQVNVGVAVALDDGLIVPVVENADARSLAEISIDLKQLVDKARKGTLGQDDISGGTFSITNLGAYGIDVFDPIITPGQSAILGVCRIADKPVVVERQILIRSMMNLCLSFDHRVVDGAPAAQYLQRVKELLESPYQLLI